MLAIDRTIHSVLITKADCLVSGNIDELSEDTINCI